VYRDIAAAFDEGPMTALIMLDLSATFHVNDHPILLKRLKFSFLIKEHALTARLVTCTLKREHITPVTFQLYWPPVRFR